jgi:hypothetical protein
MGAPVSLLIGGIVMAILGTALVLAVYNAWLAHKHGTIDARVMSALLALPCAIAVFLAVLDKNEPLFLRIGVAAACCYLIGVGLMNGCRVVIQYVRSLRSAATQPGEASAKPTATQVLGSILALVGVTFFVIDVLV